MYLQLRSVLNKANSDGNTPLHIAVKNQLPAFEIETLLKLGACVTLKNKDGDAPLARIPFETLEKFLDDQMKGAAKYETVPRMPDYMDAQKLCDCNLKNQPLDVDKYKKIPDVEVAKINFQNELENADVIFSYKLLKPFQKPVQRSQWMKEEEQMPVPSMKILQVIAKSPKHQALITHPVIRSYVWLKESFMLNRVNHSLRKELTYAYLLTWQFFHQFGGKNWGEKFADQNPGPRRPFCPDDYFTNGSGYVDKIGEKLSKLLKFS